jgi:hypothetical protein
VLTTCPNLLEEANLTKWAQARGIGLAYRMAQGDKEFGLQVLGQRNDRADRRTVKGADRTRTKSLIMGCQQEVLERGSEAQKIHLVESHVRFPIRLQSVQADDDYSGGYATYARRSGSHAT